jgi:hypothetical protein
MNGDTLTGGRNTTWFGCAIWPGWRSAAPILQWFFGRNYREIVYENTADDATFAKQCSAYTSFYAQLTKHGQSGRVLPKLFAVVVWWMQDVPIYESVLSNLLVFSNKTDIRQDGSGITIVLV